jgi:hypothetical protein
MPIEGRQKLVVNRKSVDSGQMSSQSAKSGWNVQDYLPASGVNHRHIAHELNGIAQALFGMKQNARAAERLAAPDRLRETTWLILFTLVTDFITAPTRGIVSLKQIKQAQVPSNIDGLRLQDKSAIETFARFHQLALFSLRISEVVVRLCRIWLERNGSLMTGGRFLEAAKISESISPIVVGFGRVWHQNQQSLEAGRGLLQLAELPQENTQIVISLGVIRPEDHCVW